MQSLVNAFDTDPEARLAQDVGLDGMGDPKEREYFYDNFPKHIENTHGINSIAYQKAYEDPSADNFHHYRGSDYDAESKNILERYKFFNGLEANSPPAEYNTESYTTSGPTTPNVEDINRDNTLSENNFHFH